MWLLVPAAVMTSSNCRVKDNPAHLASGVHAPIKLHGKRSSNDGNVFNAAVPGLNPAPSRGDHLESCRERLM